MYALFQPDSQYFEVSWFTRGWFHGSQTGLLSHLEPDSLGLGHQTTTPPSRVFHWLPNHLQAYLSPSRRVLLSFAIRLTCAQLQPAQSHRTTLRRYPPSRVPKARTTGSPHTQPLSRATGESTTSASRVTGNLSPWYTNLSSSRINVDTLTPGRVLLDNARLPST
jgi:hypothetical protein